MRYPARGEVWLVDLGMSAKVRPCVVMNVPFGDSDRALVTMVPHTTSARNTTFETAFRTSFLKAGAFDPQGIVTVSASRAIRLLGKLNQDQMRAVEAAVCLWLGLPKVP